MCKIDSFTEVSCKQILNSQSIRMSRRSQRTPSTLTTIENMCQHLVNLCFTPGMLDNFPVKKSTCIIPWISHPMNGLIATRNVGTNVIVSCMKLPVLVCSDNSDKVLKLYEDNTIFPHDNNVTIHIGNKEYIAFDLAANWTTTDETLETTPYDLRCKIQYENTSLWYLINHLNVFQGIYKPDNNKNLLFYSKPSTAFTFVVYDSEKSTWLPATSILLNQFLVTPDLISQHINNNNNNNNLVVKKRYSLHVIWYTTCNVDKDQEFTFSYCNEQGKLSTTRDYDTPQSTALGQ